MGVRNPGQDTGQNQSERNNCFGLIEWGAVRNSASCLLFKHAAVAGWKHQCSFLCEQDGVQPMPKDRVVQSKETLMLPWSAVWHGECCVQNSRPQEPSFGLARTTQKDFKANSTSRLQRIHSFELGGQKRSSELTTRDVLHKKTEG